MLFQNASAPLELRLQDLLGRLSIEEKMSLLPLSQAGIDRLGIEPYNMGEEAAHGVVDRDGTAATVFPQPYGLSHTWDKALMRQVGRVIGREARGLYDATHHRSFLNLFFPTIDMERDPRWGRNEEAYGEDPHLAGRLAAELIQGVQGDDAFYVQAVTGPKHFYANNYELERCYISSDLSEQLQEDYYLRVFEHAFTEGGALSTMTAYNRINGVPGMVNPEIDTIIRERWGCKGYFLTDGGAFSLLINEHHAFKTFAEGIAAAIKAGMSIFLDSPALVVPAAREALSQGLITEAEIDRVVGYSLKTRMRLGQFDVSEGPASPSANPYAPITKEVLCCKKHSKITRKAAEEAIVLLKNDGILPLNPDSIKKIAVIGPLAYENLEDWYAGNAPYHITPLQGIVEAFPNTAITACPGIDTIALKTPKGFVKVLKDGSLAFDAAEKEASVFMLYEWGYGEGSKRGAAVGIKHIESGKYLTTTDKGELVCTADKFWGWFCRELFFIKDGKFVPELARRADAAIGIAETRAQIIYNKPYADGGIERINAQLSTCSIVQLNNGINEAAEAAKDCDAVIITVGNHPLVEARECIDRDGLALPERQAALVKALSAVNKNIVLQVISGYPYSLRVQEEQSRAVLWTSHGTQELGHAIGDALSGKFSPAGRLSQTWYESDAGFPDINDYDIAKNRMTYLYTDRPVLHPFGYGQSYTNFEYRDFSVAVNSDCVEASVVIKNTGKRDSDEVPQVYFSTGRQSTAENPRPLKQLCAFERVHIKAGEERLVSFSIPKREFAFWDRAKQDFVPDDALYTIMIGASSQDIRFKPRIARIGFADTNILRETF
ncbi:MAG: glycoside hydrolase family 3 C-terminal domain-containing protein [Spirochaetaceae bacterium]|jgi:beta-glucosidase|nr:glycoside hydrolase family 3 C-terminal domain-containing protein [Spirochaetaceae bacterium]